MRTRRDCWTGAVPIPPGYRVSGNSFAPRNPPQRTWWEAARVALLIGFAVVAGAATALSPCVLPVLPVALSAGVTGGRRRPAGVVTGLALSFTFATVALVYVVDALGLPGGLLRTLAIVVLLVFGLALIVPRIAARLEAWLTRLAPARTARGGDGFGSGL